MIDGGKYDHWRNKWLPYALGIKIEAFYKIFKSVVDKFFPKKNSLRFPI